MKLTMKQRLRALLIVPVMAFGIAAVAPVAQPAFAGTTPECDTAEGDSLSLQSGANCAAGNDQATDLFGAEGIFRTITNILLFLIGAVAVIMLIIGAIRYVVSGGDSSAVTSAKNTILYAIIGIVVAVLAYAVVNFVIGALVDL